MKDNKAILDHIKKCGNFIKKEETLLGITVKNRTILL